MFVDVDAAITVPVNFMALIDDTDFKTREIAIAYNEAGMDLVWNFQTTAGVTSQTAVTPTTAGVYDWAHSGDGMYKIEIPASGGGSINNDTEGFGWFSGICTGVLPWAGPIIVFRAAGLNNALIDSAYSATRGLSGNALPDAAADAAGGLAISDVGGLDLDALNTAAIRLTAARGQVLTDWENAGRLDLVLDIIAADVVNLDGAAMRGTDSANTVVPDAAGVAPTAAEVRTEMDSNSTQLTAIIADTNELQSDDVPGLIAALDVVVDRVETDTQDLQTQIGTAGAGLTDLGGMSTTMKAQVNAEADTALTDYDPPTNAEMEARTPTAAQLTYLTDHAATAPPVTFTGGTTTTAVLENVDGSAASSVDDFYDGRVLIFNAGTLNEQATDITDYVGSTKTATITAVTTAVTSGHTAIMV